MTELGRTPRSPLEVNAFEHGVRAAAMLWLDNRLALGQETLSYVDVREFSFQDRQIPLLDPQRGIRKPRDLQAALSIRTSFTPPGQIPPYEDAAGPDGLLRYMWRGNDPDHHENVALRRAMHGELPLIWFVATSPGRYVPIYPVWIRGEERGASRFVIAFDSGQRYAPLGETDMDSRRYSERVTRQRLHQRVFRIQVLDAYSTTCSVCRLRYRSLLDAAHILPDGHARGEAIVTNGVALCKIHHAAFDANLIGITPDYVVKVRRDVSEDEDGPMLLHGLKEMAGVRLTLPSARNARPDRSRLEERYELFRAAS